MNVLVIVAHPDDEVLGAGGTLLKHSQNGDKVTVVYLATGIASRFVNDKTSNTTSTKIQKKIQKLRKDARRSGKVLKIDNLKFYDFPDNQMDVNPLLSIVTVIENEIKSKKPYRIYTHHYNDLNIDHKVVFNATLTACRPIKNTVKEVICFEVPSSTEWNYPLTFNPNYFVNITKQLEKKIQAMKMYKGEIRKFPHPRSARLLKNNAAKWGSVSGNIAAEAFEIVRKIEN